MACDPGVKLLKTVPYCNDGTISFLQLPLIYENHITLIKFDFD